MLQLELEELDELERLARHPRDRDGAVVVGTEHLAHLGVRDQVAGGRAPIADHDDAVRELQAEHGGPVRDREGVRLRQRAGHRLRSLALDQIEEAGARTERAAGEGQLGPIAHSPPFWTYDLTNSSAFSSSTESISSRMSSISSLSSLALEDDVT